MSAFTSTDSETNGIFTFHFTEEDITRSKLLKFIVKVIASIKTESRPPASAPKGIA